MQPSVLLARSLIALGLLIGIAMQAPARAENRIALVVGNNAYENVPKLEKAVNDAKAVAASLRSIGFEVLLATDVNRRDFARQLAEFNGRVQTNDLALFFYAGHGIEVRGANYVLPVDVPAARDGQETLITGEAIPTEKIVSDLQDRGARAAVLILDACRDNPFKRPGTRSVGGVRGLALASPPEGVFVLYSAGVGQAALDRASDGDPDSNSVFTRIFLKEIGRSDATMIEVAKATQVQVRSIALNVGHAQVPAYYDQIIGQLRLGAKNESLKAPATPPATAERLAGQSEASPSIAVPTEPAPQVSARIVALTNKGLEDYLRKAPAISVHDAFKTPKAVANCDLLTSMGPDDPDSRAPRVPRDKIDVAGATKACVTAILQEPGTPRLRAQLARALLTSASRNDKSAAHKILSDLAKDDYAVAMWLIAIAHLVGNGVKEDTSQGLDWYRRAAQKGLGVAMSDLGRIYGDGDGVEKNPAEGARWFERAAAIGNARGMRNYALVLDRGEGVGANPIRAADYLLTAYRMGSDDAKKSLFNLHESWRLETKQEVQKLLQQYGFYNGPISGAFDADTFNALRALAAANPVAERR